MTLESTTPRIAPARTHALLGVLVVLVAVTSCASTPTAQDLLGMWASKATVTASGTTSESFCFSKDGSIEWIAQTPRGSSTHRGTFKLAGDVLTIQVSDVDTAPTLKAKMRFGALELTSSTGSTQKYSRVLGSCDDNR